MPVGKGRAKLSKTRLARQGVEGAAIFAAANWASTSRTAWGGGVYSCSLAATSRKAFHRVAALEQAAHPVARCDSIAEVVSGVLWPRTKSAQVVSAICSTHLSKIGDL